MQLAKQAVTFAIQPGREKKSARRSAVSAIADAKIPQTVNRNRVTLFIEKLAQKTVSSRIVGVDPAVAEN
jgi:alpha-D-ribose 1-methylphosphonate 5-triphosphate synthase subunit PhnG